MSLGRAGHVESSSGNFPVAPRPGWKVRGLAGRKACPTMFAADSQDINFGIYDRKDSWHSNCL
jgi:hypothetical protein